MSIYNTIHSRSAIKLTVIGMLTLLTVLGVGCASTCDDNRNSMPLAGFYAMVDGKMQSVTVDSLQVIGVGVPGDSVLSDVNSISSTLHLPFQIDKNETAYDFIAWTDNKTELRDRVIFRYTRVPQFVSQECGVSYRYNIENISWEGVFIDSVTCPKGYIDNRPIENIHIYFRVTP